MSSSTLEEEATGNGTDPKGATVARTARTARTRGTTPLVGDDGAPRVIIKPIETELIVVTIQGTAPLIVSRFSEKAKQMMLDAQQGVKRQKEVRDPAEEYRNSLYLAGKASAEDALELTWTDPKIIDPDTQGPYTWTCALDQQLHGLPSMAFKMATISAARLYGKSVKMTELRQFMYFDGRKIASEANRITIIQGDPYMRQDYVRLAGVNRPADLRFRGCFGEWQARLVIRYTKNLLDRESLINLIEAGGLTVGVGEWRPERDGEFGTYQVINAQVINSPATLAAVAAHAAEIGANS